MYVYKASKGAACYIIYNFINILILSYFDFSFLELR
jgi:hypothetical protein